MIYANTQSMHYTTLEPRYIELSKCGNVPFVCVIALHVCVIAFHFMFHSKHTGMPRSPVFVLRGPSL